MCRGSWENTIEFIQSLVGNSYVTKTLYIKDWGACQIYNNERSWTSFDGKILLLGKEDNLSSLEDGNVYDTGDLFKVLSELHDRNSSFVIGNNFYYPSGIDLNYDDRLVVPTSLNNIVYYGNRNDLLGIATKEVYNYVLFNNLDVNIEDREYIKKKIKKICH